MTASTLINDRPVIVDMFCGSGGESQGIDWSAKKAGVKIEMFAINHWQRAIETHRANFPAAEHICRDVRDIDPSSLMDGRKIALLWASPACTHFSVARGGKPCDDQSRVTPFTVLDWLDKLTVDRVIIENVPEFRSWGALDETTHRPVPERKGETFDAFIGMIRSLGYSVDWQVLNAADFGAQTTRRRLFIQAVRTGSGKSILWPEPSHAQISPNSTLTKRLPAWVPARDIIDWSLPTQIIDERKKPLVENTMKRILRGIEKYWGPYAEPFLVRYNGGEDTEQYVTTTNDPERRKSRLGPDGSTGAPARGESRRIGGNCGVQPLVMHIGQTSSKGRTRSINEPLATVVTKEEACLIEPLIMPYRSQSKVRPASESPIPTLVTFGWIGVVEPLILEYYGNGGCHKISETIPVIPTRDRFALITPERVTPENVRIGFRMLKPHELSAAQSFPRDYIFTGNRGEIVKQIGNAVCPLMAEALTAGYMRELACMMED
ncbi:MAG: DNA cytosine methyltransferase [Dehalococcoidia bacterium]|jgi:DNA (cytosine-5)-methyltransferase 1